MTLLRWWYVYISIGYYTDTSGVIRWIRHVRMLTDTWLGHDVHYHTCYLGQLKLRMITNKLLNRVFLVPKEITNEHRLEVIFDIFMRQLYGSNVTHLDIKVNCWISKIGFLLKWRAVALLDLSSTKLISEIAVCSKPMIFEILQGQSGRLYENEENIEKYNVFDNKSTLVNSPPPIFFLLKLKLLLRPQGQIIDVICGKSQ